MKHQKAYKKDIWRSMQKNRKRLIAIMLITFLGTMMFSGLKAACVDLRHSADAFYDQQQLFDICIRSTLGLTKDDLEALRTLEGVEAAEGVYSETVHANVEAHELDIALTSFSLDGLNQPYLLEGQIPTQSYEVAITQNFAELSGLCVGDWFSIREDGEDVHFLETNLQVTAIVIDALDVNNPNGSVSFRASSTDESVVYILQQAVESDVYTAVYLTLQGSQEMFCYSEEYEQNVEAFREEIETKIQKQRTEARTKQVQEEAYQQLEETKQEVYAELEQAKQELLEAQEQLEQELSQAKETLYAGEQSFWQQIAQAKAQLSQGEADLAQGLEQLEEAERLLQQQEKEADAEFEKAQMQILDGYVELEEGQKELYAGKAQLELAETALLAEKTALQTKQNAEAAVIQKTLESLEENLTKNREKQQKCQETIQTTTVETERFLAEQTYQLLQSEETILETQKLSLQEQLKDIDTKYASQWQELAEQEQQLLAGKQQILQGQEECDKARTQLEAGLSELERQQAYAEEQFAQGRKQIAEGRKALESGKAQLIAGWAELEQGQKEGEIQLKEGYEAYEQGEETAREQLADGWMELEGGTKEAQQQLVDAQKALEDMDIAEWYIQDRTSLSGYSNIKSDADSIDSIANVFPIVFFVVAILISLTTITRMVEEDRGLIGTYKSLGFSNREIRRKYIIYAFGASTAGSILGTLGAFLLLPAIICYIFSTMYLLPEYRFLFEPVNGLTGPFLFVGGIVAATIIACQNELSQTPVTLMRPKTPKAGSRVILEYIPFLWNKMTFLNKVTARNLFRYKKRLFMTIFGIAGCMALLLFGFAVKDTVTDIVPRQYEQTFFYDAMVVASDQDVLGRYLQKDPNIAEYLESYIMTVTLKNTDGETESAQLVVVSDETRLPDYIELRHTDGKITSLEDGEIMITQNASILLELEAGSETTIQTMTLEQAQVAVTDVVENYLSNYVYMTKQTYEQYFGTYESNGALLYLAETCKDPILFCDTLGKQEGIASCISTDAMKEDFASAFVLINMVVYIVIIMAACLAFVVLFTLATTNVSERIRELATIKVLGFYDQEVHAYVNKETMILTAIGILVGIPLGYAFAQTLTSILNLPSMYLAVSLHSISYIIAAGLSFFFALCVNVMTDRSLDVINPVEALKSVE